MSDTRVYVFWGKYPWLGIPEQKVQRKRKRIEIPITEIETDLSRVYPALVFWLQQPHDPLRDKMGSEIVTRSADVVKGPLSWSQGKGLRSHAST